MTKKEGAIMSRQIDPESIECGIGPAENSEKYKHLVIARQRGAKERGKKASIWVHDSIGPGEKGGRHYALAKRTHSGPV